jgi:predicted AAA+ superfamily ATPase
MYIKRAIESSLLNISESFPVLLLTGPRQVGKTTLLQKLGAARSYVTLDNPDARTLAKTDPGLFLQRYTPPVTIDEIQYAPELLPYIKMRVDSERKTGEYWLTGSQTFLTMKGIRESLAGRVGIVNLLGLSYSEITRAKSEPFTTDFERIKNRIDTVPKATLSEVFERIITGGMPALYANKNNDRDTFFSSYTATYLQRDIRDLAQVGDELAFYKFMICVAARTAKPVVLEEIAKDADISPPTAKKWLSLLVSSHIVALVQPYYNNILKRVTKMPLLHFLDTGLCSHLLKWQTAETLELGAMSGQFFESYVFSEIYKSYINAAKEPPLFYYRDKDKHEIDLLLSYDGTLFPIEIKKSASPGRDAVKNFSVLSDLTRVTDSQELPINNVKIGTGAVICLSSDLLPINKDVWCVPVWTV